MLVRALGALVAVVVVCGAGGSPLPLERPALSVDLVPLTTTVVGHDLDVGVIVSGSFGEGAVARVLVSAPDGLQIAGGDSSFSEAPVGLVPMHMLHLSGQGTGQRVLRTRVTVIQADQELAVSEVALPIQVAGDTLVAGSRNHYRSEFFEADQRYRISGLWLVPVDAPEEIDPADVLAAPVKPTIVNQKTAKCPNCGTSPQSVRVLVVIDRSGFVRHARAAPGERAGAAADSARAAVTRWQFAPARIGKTPVSDCVLVSVPVSR
jgi:hypothetical protein